MKMLKKIVALMAVALMLCSIMPMAVMAADGDVTITTTGTSGALASDKLSISWTSGDYSVVNYKNTSTNAIRTSDSAHFRAYVGSQVVVSGGAMSQVVFNCESSYVIDNTANTYSSGWTMSVNGKVVTYTATSGSASELVITIGKQSRFNSVVITPASAGGSPDCDHGSLDCGDTCPECEEYVKEHVFANNCAATCSNCDEANPDYADHVYDGAYDATCNVCGATREVNFPEADTELTIPEADEIGLGMSHDTTTPGKYYVTGVVESIANTTYGNLYIQDEDGNKLYVYGTYSEDGSVRFDAMTEKPEVGMTITVYGVIGNYNNASQMKNAWITSMEGGCEHEYEFDCSKSCDLCGLELRPEAKCETDAEYDCHDGLCIYCGGDVDGLGHAFDDQWDPDCNYGCGETREVEERPEMTEATIDFSTTDLRTEYSSAAQKWENGGLVVLNEKDASTTNVGDYSNPVRFYKSSSVTISFVGMTSLVIDCSSTGDAKYSTPWGDMLTAAGYTYTVEEKVYTVTFAEPVDSITLSCSAQVRANSITATATKKSEPDEPEHVCQFTGTETKAPTCTEDGVKTYSCTCGEGTYTEAIPALGHTAGAAADCVNAQTCTVCGAELAAALGHTAGAAADCVNAQTCTVCGAELAAALGHDWTDADCDTPKTCSVCGATDGEALGHNFADGTCGVCGETDPNYVPPCQHEYFYPCDPICMKCGEMSNPDAKHNVEHVAAKAPTCTAIGNIEYWYCTDCGSAWTNAELTVVTNPMSVKLPMADHEYFYPCDPVCMNCYELTNPDATHTVVHVDAVAPTCTAMGNIEYWYCSDCGSAWTNAELTAVTNPMSVKLAATCATNAIHTEGVEAGCHYTGLVENWYCANCDVYYLDAACTIITNYKSLTIPALMDSAEYVPAKAPTCTENGNVEYWVCYECEQVWANEALTQLTNIKNVVAPASGHSYTNAHDTTCNNCDAVRTLVLAAEEIILVGGNSVTEDAETGAGLAFKFETAVDGITFKHAYGYYADYSNAAITIGTETYTLVEMGAIVNNKGENGLTLADVAADTEGRVLKVAAVKVFADVDNTINYAIRITNIPANKLDAEIIARSYYTYEKNGEQITIYGDDVAASYNVVKSK